MNLYPKVKQFLIFINSLNSEDLLIDKLKKGKEKIG